MQKFYLTGLAEGLLGQSVAEAHSQQELFEKTLCWEKLSTRLVLMAIK